MTFLFKKFDVYLKDYYSMTDDERLVINAKVKASLLKHYSNGNSVGLTKNLAAKETSVHYDIVHMIYLGMDDLRQKIKENRTKNSQGIAHENRQ